MGIVVKWIMRGIGAVAVLAAFALAVGAIFEGVSERAAAKKFPPPGRLVDVAGTTLHIDCVGEGGPTIVVDVGAGNWSTHWKHIQKKLAAGGRVCLYDRIGFGWSDASLVRRTGAGLAMQLHALLTAAGETPPYIMVGHSFGGYIIRFHHDLYPDEVVGVVLVESGHEDQFQKMPYLTERLAGAGKQMKTAALMARFGALRFMTLPKTQKNLPDPALQAVVDEARKTPKYWNAMAATLPAGISVAEELSGKGRLGDSPLLIISAARSAYAYCRTLGVDCEQTEADWDQLQASFIALSSNVMHVVHPTATHEINIDDPAFLVDQIERFRDRWR